MSTSITAAALRVASDLRHITVEGSGDHPRDVIHGDIVYRLLDAPYYAWLRCRMDRAKKAFDGRKLPAPTWQTLRERFNAINAWAVAHIGEQALLDAIATLDEKSYPPPRHDHTTALIDSWNERAAIMEHDGGQDHDTAEQSAARLVSRELTPEDVESFKALGVVVHVKSSVGDFTLVPEYTGKDRPEMSAEDFRKISMVMHAFPGSEITYLGPRQERPGEAYEPQVAAPQLSAASPTPEPEPQQPATAQHQAPLF